MMLDVFTEPDTVTCILCRATVSIRKGDKARFFNHISLDHEVHYDMDLFFVVSFLSEAQKDTVINIISKKFERKEKSNNNRPKDLDNITKQNDVTKNQEKSTEKQVSETTETSITKKESKEEVLRQDDDTKKQDNSAKLHLTVTETSVPKNENTDTVEEVLILNVKPEKDPLDVEETIHETSATNIEALINNDEEKCSICDMILPKKVMQAHINIEHKLRVFTKSTCKICKKIMFKKSYKRHMKLVHNISNSQLEESQDQDENDLENTHVVNENTFVKDTETKSSYTKCKLCYRTIMKKLLRKHMTMHTGRIICPLCYISFTDERYRNLHVAKVHKNEEHLLNDDREPNFSEADCNVVCPDCDRKFISETSMKWHCRRKHGSGSHQCEKCKRKFRESLMYDIHILHCLSAPN